MKEDVGGAELHYEIHGDSGDDRRPWLIFSHSLACSVGMWTPQLAEFSRRYRVLAFDTRGHGRSDATAGAYTMDLLAADLHGLLGALKITRAHFIGLSMGGMIGQTYALAHPGVFTSMTLADTTSRWPPEAMQVFAERAQVALTQGMAPLVEATLGRWFTPPFHKSHPAEVARIGDMIRATPVAGYAGCSDAIPRVNTTARLREIACPILVMVGKDDPGTPVAMSRTIHENAPGSELVVIESAAHLSNIEQPQVFNQALTRFLGRLDK
ncbi:MAG TPA: alpha/beta fold hydrolase [Polyangia bacterium]|jgi:3-oxoadipate enol-lactonase|nr:alpha/beta fold hydrolase [Polyangia bacterium]